LKTLHKELKTLYQERDKLANIVTNNNQNKLKAGKFRTLGLIKKALNSAKSENNETILDGRNYETEINNATSLEEVEALREEVLFQIAEKSQNYSSNQVFSNKKEKAKKNYSGGQASIVQPNDKILKDLVQEFSKINSKQSSLDIQGLENKLTKTKQKSNKLKNQLHNLQKKFNSETQNFNREIRNLKEQSKFQ
jgi:fumarate hydratase class II